MGTDTELTAIRAREQKATKGPWEHDIEVSPSDSGSRITISVDGAPIAEVLNSDDFPCLDENEDAARVEAVQLQAAADADFVAHARTDIPALLDLVEQQRYHRLMKEGRYMSGRTVEELEADLAELRGWRDSERQFLLAAAAELLVAGFKGDGVLEGIKWVIADRDRLAAALEAVRKRLEQICTDDYGPSGGRIVKGNTELPDPAGGFYRGYNAGIEGQFQKTREIANQALAALLSPEGRE